MDGSIPDDNPKFTKNKNWLPEIFQIGVRNPQGMSLSPFDGKIYITNHGARGGDWFGTVKIGENYGWKILVGAEQTILGLKLVLNGNQVLQKLSNIGYPQLRLVL